MNYKIIRLIDKPEMKEQMANWVHEKWSVPLEAYQESMNDCLTFFDSTERRLLFSRIFTATNMDL